MDSMSNITQRNASLINDPEGTPPQGTTSYTLQKGDTLSKLAQGLQRQGVAGTLAEIIKQIRSLNPQIKNEHRVTVGATLQLPAAPGQPAPRQPESKTNLVETFIGRSLMTAAAQLLGPAQPAGPSIMAGLLAFGGTVKAQAASFLHTNAVPFPTSSDGTPLYKQGDSAWGSRLLGDGAPISRTVSQAGCAMTSVAMALSKLSGEPITPAVLDAFLDKHNGYDENAIYWSTAGKVTKQPISVEKRTWNLDTINTELAAGRPVVIGVDYKDGSRGGNNGTDHWVCLTRREAGPPEIYYANDPASGEEVRFLRQSNGKLQEEMPSAGRQKYKSTGELVTFSKPAKS